jgi:hypothetical protein
VKGARLARLLLAADEAAKLDRAAKCERSSSRM